MSNIGIALRGEHIAFEREDVELPDGVLGLLADIAAPIAIAPDEFVVIPSTVHAKTDGSVIGLIEVHAGRHRDDHDDPNFGTYFAPKPDEETLVLVTVTNHTASTVVIQPKWRIGLMIFRELRLAEHGDGRSEEGGHPTDLPKGHAANDEDSATAVGIVYQPQHIDAQTTPQYATAGSAALDLRADLEESVVLAPGERRLVTTGLRLAIPEGFEAQVRPRSGLALKHGITIVNAPGTVDSDYRGDVGVILMNAGQEPFTIEPGDRIAQLLFAPVSRLPLDFRAELDQTDRGAGGFGSTGRR